MSITMNALNRKALGKLGSFLPVLAGAVFLAAWTVDYWQAWIFLAIFGGSSLAITAYLMEHDPKLLERRVYAGPRSEKQTRQQIIQAIAFVSFFALLLFPAFDHRFGWSAVPSYIALAGDALVAFGFLIVFFVFKENTFASATIEVDTGQKVVSTGPYSIVRHPMYSGALIMLVGVPIALGSWWGLLMVIPITIVIIWRLLEEEKFLAESLPGYSEYRNKVTYRLAPLIW
ncbi:MAG: isoprenylcysteine carboxylmethyltransferase family protein [Candidatus Binataceae bacterium]